MPRHGHRLAVVARYLAGLSLSFAAGCGGSATGPTANNLVGRALDDVKTQLGQPTHQTLDVVPESWAGSLGPHPAQLKPGDKYLSVHFSDYHGEMIVLFAVTPALYQQVKGVSPGAKPAYVLEAHMFPRDVVF